MIIKQYLQKAPFHLDLPRCLQAILCRGKMQRPAAACVGHRAVGTLHQEVVDDGLRPKPKSSEWNVFFRQILQVMGPFH